VVTRRELMKGFLAAAAARAPGPKQTQGAAAAITPPVAMPPPMPPKSPKLLKALFDAAEGLPNFNPPAAADQKLALTDWDFTGAAQELAKSPGSLAHEWSAVFTDAKYLGELIDWIRDFAAKHPDFDFRWLSSIGDDGTASYSIDMDALVRANKGKEKYVVRAGEGAPEKGKLSEQEVFETNLRYFADKLQRLPGLRECTTLEEAAAYLESLLPHYFDPRFLPPLTVTPEERIFMGSEPLSEGIGPAFRAFLNNPPEYLRESLSRITGHPSFQHVLSQGGASPSGVEGGEGTGSLMQRAAKAAVERAVLAVAEEKIGGLPEDLKLAGPEPGARVPAVTGPHAVAPTPTIEGPKGSYTGPHLDGPLHLPEGPKEKPTR